eukprot:1776501-Rhodomonas_salina.2
MHPAEVKELERAPARDCSFEQRWEGGHPVICDSCISGDLLDTRHVEVCQTGAAADSWGQHSQPIKMLPVQVQVLERRTRAQHCSQRQHASLLDSSLCVQPETGKVAQPQLLEAGA